LKLELSVDAAPIRWRPSPEAVERARRLVEAWGPSDGVLEVVLTGDGRIHDLNRRYRGKDRPTDVLSFSYLEGHEERRDELLHGRLPAREFSGDPPVDDDAAPVLVGEVLISVETMQRRDVRLDHDDDEEFVFLVVHGMLHTLGFDHAHRDEAMEMEKNMEMILDGAFGDGSEAGSGGSR